MTQRADSTISTGDGSGETTGEHRHEHGALGCDHFLHCGERGY